MLKLEIQKLTRHDTFSCDNCDKVMYKAYMLGGNDNEIALCGKCIKALPSFIETQLTLLKIVKNEA